MQMTDQTIQPRRCYISQSSEQGKHLDGSDHERVLGKRGETTRILERKKKNRLRFPGLALGYRYLSFATG
jgi:hypothetical protein